MSIGWQRPEPGEHDDWMDVADAVGVTRTPEPIDPALAVVLSDGNLAAVTASWARSIAFDDHADTGLCPMCGDTGLYAIRSLATGLPTTIPCPACPPDDGRDDR